MQFRVAAFFADFATGFFSSFHGRKCPEILQKNPWQNPPMFTIRPKIDLPDPYCFKITFGKSWSSIKMIFPVNLCCRSAAWAGNSLPELATELFQVRAAKRGCFKRRGFPIWTCPSFFVPFCPFWDFPDFSGIFPICSGTVRGFSRFVLFFFLGLLKAPTRNSPERVRDTIWTFPEKSGKHPGLETPPFSFSQEWSGQIISTRLTWGTPKIINEASREILYTPPFPPIVWPEGI